MLNLTPEEAGTSAIALAIAKRFLNQPALSAVRVAMAENENLRVFCGHLAREVDCELGNAGLTFRMAHHLDPGITLTSSERGALDGLLAKGDSTCQAFRTAREVTREAQMIGRGKRDAIRTSDSD